MLHLGTTFDYEYAFSLGLDWKETLKRIISLRISPVRIGIKWNRVEYKEKKFNWDIYDCILQKLTKNNVPVILVVGMKSPRWPEFYIPEFYKPKFIKRKKITNEFSNLKARLLKFINLTLQRYGQYKNIKFIQVENEHQFGFGPENLSIDDNFIKGEIQEIKKISDIPILLTTQGLPTTGILPELLKGKFFQKVKLLQMADNLGVNVYPCFEGKLFGKFVWVFRESRLSWFYLKKYLMEAKKAKKEVMIAELQAEPWEETDDGIKDSGAFKTCNPRSVTENIRKFQNWGINTILLWGVEFHVLCEKAGNDDWMKIYECVK